MDDVTFDTQAEADGTDRTAILMMLTYVEAECRRLGDDEAARHAALAVQLITGKQVSQPLDRSGRHGVRASAPLN
jgi:hypothetical protein